MLTKNRLLLLASLATSGSALAAMPLITDDTGTQGSGGNQLEISVGEDKTKVAGGFTEKSQQIPSVTYTRGLSETVDVFASATWLKNSSDDPLVNSEKGSSNPSLGVKWRLFENDRKTSLAVKAVVALPVSEEKQTRGLGDGELSRDATLILSQELGFGSAHANVGAGKVGVKNGPEEKTTHISVAPVFNLGEAFKLAFDLGQDTNKPEGGSKTTTRYWEAGLMFSPDKDIDLALGYIQARDRGAAEPTKTITGGVTWRF